MSTLPWNATNDILHNQKSDDKALFMMQKSRCNKGDSFAANGVVTAATDTTAAAIDTGDTDDDDEQSNFSDCNSTDAQYYNMHANNNNDDDEDEDPMPMLKTTGNEIGDQTSEAKTIYYVNVIRRELEDHDTQKVPTPMREEEEKIQDDIELQDLLRDYPITAETATDITNIMESILEEDEEEHKEVDESVFEEVEKEKLTSDQDIEEGKDDGHNSIEKTSLYSPAPTLVGATTSTSPDRSNATTTTTNNSSSRATTHSVYDCDYDYDYDYDCDDDYDGNDDDDDDVSLCWPVSTNQSYSGKNSCDGLPREQDRCRYEAPIEQGDDEDNNVMPLKNTLSKGRGLRPCLFLIFILFLVMGGAILTGVCVSRTCFPSNKEASDSESATQQQSGQPPPSSSPLRIRSSMAPTTRLRMKDNSTVAAAVPTNLPVTQRPTLPPKTVTNAPSDTTNKTRPTTTPIATLDDAKSVGPSLVPSTGSAPKVSPVAVTRAPTRNAAPAGSAPAASPIRSPMAPFSVADARATDIVTYINNITLSGVIYDTPISTNATSTSSDQNSHQLALHWIIYDDPLQLKPVTLAEKFRIRQRYALRSLIVQQQQQSGWTSQTGWDSTTSNPHECEWFGLTCREMDLNNGGGSSRVVTELKLSWNNLRGSIPTDLGLLSFLERIELQGNPQLSGSLPQSIGRWSNLKYIDLTGNSHFGQIPSSVGNWREASSVYLSANKFSGTLPVEISKWTNLLYVDVGPNSLTGSIPNKIGTAWTKIQSASFDWNEFTGTLPSGLCANQNTYVDADCISEVVCNCCDNCY